MSQTKMSPQRQIIENLKKATEPVETSIALAGVDEDVAFRVLIQLVEDGIVHRTCSKMGPFSQIVYWYEPNQPPPKLTVVPK